MLLDAITVTDIAPPIVVHSQKGRTYQTRCRPSWGLSLCRDGQLTYTMAGQRYVSTPAVAVLLPKGGAYSLLGDADGHFPVVNFQCTGLPAQPITLLPLQDAPACLAAFEALHHATLYRQDRLQTYSLFYRLLHLVKAQTDAAGSPLHSALGYIEARLGDAALRNGDVAAHLGISEVYLRKLFVRYLHTTPHQYILELRLRRAVRLLCDTSLPVGVVAEDCGFASVYHFSRIFSQRHGASPTAYAAAHRQWKI